MKYYNGYNDELTEDGIDYINSIMSTYDGSKREKLKKTSQFIDMSLLIAKAGLKNPFDPGAHKYYAFLYFVRYVLIQNIYNTLDGDGPEFITTWN